MSPMGKKLKRKIFGQHFLKDQKTIDRILSRFLEESRKAKLSKMVEIGPGKGALTDPLLEQLEDHETLLLIEKDRHLAKDWSNRLEDQDRTRIIPEDFLKLESKDYLDTTSVGILSNLPYSVSTRILDRLSYQRDQIGVMVLMFQKEVADRILAKAHDKNRGSLSVWMQNIWKIESFLKVPQSAFRPPPKVESSVLVFWPRSEARVLGSEKNNLLWENLLKQSFGQRRKMLRSSLKGSRWAQALKLSGLDETLRPQALGWEEWQRLFQAGLN